MTRSEVLETLRTHMSELRAMGVASLALFGSVAGGDSRDESDVDLLVELRRPTGLFQFFRIQHFLEESLGVERVDLIERGALHPLLRERILSEAIDVS